MRAAAIAVFEAKQLSKSVFCLLAGLSIELLLKGILLGLSDRFPTTHDLFALSQKAGISSSNDEKVLLHALTEYISWKSKYPTPKDEENWNRAENVLKQQRNTSGKLGAIYTPERSESLENYSSLWNKYANYFWRVHESVH